MNRFEFLKSEYEELYKLCSEAEEQHNMNKARQVIEILVRQFGANKRHLFDRIGEVSEKAAMPKDIVAAFHQVRLVGNKASHDETLAWNKITDEDVKKCLDALFEIVVWLVFSHDKKIYDFVEFNPEDLKIADKYLNDEAKAKRNKIKEIGSFINSLDIADSKLNFDNAVEDELQQDVFETKREYIKRVSNLPLQHIGYAILDNRTRDNHTGLTFAMFHIEKNDKIIFSDVKAFVSNMSSDGDFIDGKIVVGLKVDKDKVYCDYDRVYLQSQDGVNIKLTAICWEKYKYEKAPDFKKRLKKLPILPLGVGKPIRKDYDLTKKTLPFKIALYNYVQTILDIDKVSAVVDRQLAKTFCEYKETFILYGNVNENKKGKILKNVNYDGEVAVVLSAKKRGRKSLAAIQKAEATGETVTKSKRGRKKKETDTTEVVTKSKRGRKKKEADTTEVVIKSKRGRKKKETATAEVEVATKSKMGRKKKEIAAAEVATQPKRGRKKASEKPQNKENVKEKIASLKSKVKEGDIYSMLELGRMYQEGRNVEQDGKKAVKYYKKALNTKDGKDNINVMRSIADIYRFGTGVEKDGKVAIKYLKSAIKAAAKTPSIDVDEVKRVIYNEIGEIYFSGDGIEKSTPTAMKWYQKAATLNNIGSMIKMADIYRNGNGIEQNGKAAIKWYKKIIKLNVDARAQIDSMKSIAEMYKDGQGVEKDEKQSQQWYKKAEKANKKLISNKKKNSH